jgi:gamma-polyglutamate biosynthesis protein CapA
MRNILFSCAIISVIVLSSLGTFGFWKAKFAHAPARHLAASVSPIPKAHTPAPEHKPVALTLLFVGDVMLDRGVEYGIRTYGKESWSWPFMPIAETLRRADILFGNLESQISDKGTKVGSIYSFRANPKAVQPLQHAGFDVMSTVNNHSYDYTKAAYLDSQSRLRQAGIMPADDTLAIQQAKGTTIGFLAYSNFPGPAFVHSDNLRETLRAITQAKAKVDILVISLHAGKEYTKDPNEFQNMFAKKSIDAGADLIIGHHPHVLQPLEQYKHGWIVYSLGNFLFDQTFSEETMQGAIFQAKILDKKIQEVSLLPTRITKTFQVELVAEK